MKTVFENIFLESVILTQSPLEIVFAAAIFLTKPPMQMYFEGGSEAQY